MSCVGRCAPCPTLPYPPMSGDAHPRGPYAARPRASQPARPRASQPARPRASQPACPRVQSTLRMRLQICRMIPFLVLGFWDKNTGIVRWRHAMSPRFFRSRPGSRHFKLKRAGLCDCNLILSVASGHSQSCSNSTENGDHIYSNARIFRGLDILYRLTLSPLRDYLTCSVAPTRFVVPPWRARPKAVEKHCVA